jgi:hypothetical protein
MKTQSLAVRMVCLLIERQLLSLVALASQPEERLVDHPPEVAVAIAGTCCGVGVRLTATAGV